MQLADDCFAFGGPLMTAGAALAILAERVTRVAEPETAPLGAALGRILAEDVASPIAVPPADNAAVDGYALAFDDLAPGEVSRLAVSARVAAGRAAEGQWEPGTAARVFTGAALPKGCDTVVMQEDVRQEDGMLLVPPGLKRGANRRKAGEDLAPGRLALAAGTRLRAQELGLLAAMGRAEVPVYGRLRVALFSTGDELEEPGRPLPPGAIYDSNRHLLAGVLQGLGVSLADLGILPDRPEAVRAALQAAAARHDLLITSGGVSTGEEDHVRAAVEALGRLHFWRLAIKPGRPLALGQIGRVPFLGLPGNPVAAMVCLLRFGRSLILRLGGATATEPRLYPVRAGFEYRKRPERREYLRARLVEQDGALWAEPFARQGSGIISSLVQSDGLVELDEAVTEVARGSMVPFLPFSEVSA